MAAKTSRIEMDDKLDFLSSKFDPLKALYNRNLQPPILNIKVFNNLVEYAVAIKEGKTKSTTVSTRNKAQSVKSLAPHAASRTKNLKPEYKPAEKEVLQERLKAIAESKACTAEDRKTGMKMGGRLEDTKLREFMLAEETFKAQQRKKKRMDVIQKMEDLRQGPFRILHTCLTERRRIQVWTRRYKGLRSVLAGYLVAFDKHMNLALFDVDEVYTLEERVERQESPEKTKKKKKRMKKTANSLLENEITEEIMKSESADRNSSTMFVIDFQAGTKTFLPCTNAKPSSNCSKSTCSNTVESVCDVSKDAFEDSSSPSAKALSTALQTPFFHPVDHAHQSPLTTDDENSASKESEDLKDSKGSDNSVSKNKSDFQTIKTPTRGVSVCVNGNGKNVQIGNEKEPTQTHNFEFMTEMSGETVKEERPLHCTHGEKRIERTENANGSNILQGETHYLEVHARNLTKLELCGSLETAHCGEASVPFVEDKDCGAIIVRDSRLVDNDTILLRRENNVKHDKEQIERAVAERNSPMTLLECFESGETEENVEKLQGSIECVPLSSKKVDDFIGSVSRDSTVDISSCLSTREPGLPSVNETCGATKATAEKGNNAEAVHEQEESVFADEKFQNRNIILALDSIIQLESESKDLEEVSRDDWTGPLGQISSGTETDESLYMDYKDTVNCQNIEKGNPVNFKGNERSTVNKAPEGFRRTESNFALRSARLLVANEDTQETTSHFIRGDCHVSETCFTSQSVCITTTEATTCKEIPAFSSFSSSLIYSDRDFQPKESICRTRLDSVSETGSILQNAVVKATQPGPLKADGEYDLEAKKDERPSLMFLNPSDSTIGEFSDSQENRCNLRSSTVDSRGDPISPATCVVVSTEEEKIDKELEPETVSNATSEFWKTDHLKSSGKGPSLQCGAKLDQRKKEEGVSFAKKTNEFKEIEDKEEGEITSEEGEITSEEEGALEAQKQNEEDKEEGELSSSDSDVEIAIKASSRGTQQETARHKNEVGEGKNKFRRKEKELCLIRGQLTAELREKSFKEKSRQPGNSGHEGRASLSSAKTSDLRAKLSQMRKKRSLLSSGSSGSNTKAHDYSLRGTQSAAKQEKVKQDGLNALNKANKKDIKLMGSSQTKREHTDNPLRGSGSSPDCNPLSNDRRSKVKGSTETAIARSSRSHQEVDDIKRKMRSTNSRRKTEGRSQSSHFKSNKTDPNSTPHIESKCKENKGSSGSVESHRTIVKARKPSIIHGTLIVKNSYSSEDKKLAKDSEMVVGQKMKASASSQVSVSGSLPKRVTIENSKNEGSAGKCTLRNSDLSDHLSDSRDERSLGRHSESETTSTHAKGSSESDIDGRRKTRSLALKSQLKEQSKSRGNLKVTDESKEVVANAEKQQAHRKKGVLKQAKTTVKVSPRNASRKVVKNANANVTSKTKRQPEQSEIGGTRKRRRAGSETVLQQVKKLRLEPEDKDPPKLPEDASTFEIPRSNLKRGENGTKIENQRPTCKNSHSEIRMDGHDDLERTKTLTYKDGSQKNTNRLHSPQLKTVIVGGNKCLVYKHRHVNQLFLRGDNVVMVAYAK